MRGYKNVIEGCGRKKHTYKICGFGKSKTKPFYGIGYSGGSFGVQIRQSEFESLFYGFSCKTEDKTLYVDRRGITDEVVIEKIIKLTV